MKVCICAILLLLCRMIHSFDDDTPTQGCLLGDAFYPVGVHTTRSCLRVTCDIYGQITFQACPEVCPPTMKIVGWTYGKNYPAKSDYPECCLQPICKPGYNKISEQIQKPQTDFLLTNKPSVF